MKRIYYIVNLVSGKSTIGSNLGDVLDIFTKAGYETTVHPTQNADDARQMAIETSACGKFDYIVCSGGDGTFSQTINGVLNSHVDTTIGYIPSGSTNDFAKSIGIPINAKAAAESFIHGKKVKLDVGRCNNKTFMYVAAFGAFTDISYDTPQYIKNILGHAAYIFNGLSKFGKYLGMNYKMRVEYIDENDIKHSFEGEYIYGMITNSASVAGFVKLNNFLFDDGLFEVTLIKNPRNLIELNNIAASLNNLSIGANTSSFRSFRAKKIKFEELDGKKVPWTLDGETGGNDKVHTIDNLNKAITLKVTNININEFERVEEDIDK